jgi:hypothetical protein
MPNFRVVWEPLVSLRQNAVPHNFDTDSSGTKNKNVDDEDHGASIQSDSAGYSAVGSGESTAWKPYSDNAVSQDLALTWHSFFTFVVRGAS